MLFNSLDFAVFLPLVFALYWALRPLGLRPQNLLLLAASYVFYGWWDWRFLGLIVFSSLIDYLVGLRLERDGPRRPWLYLSLAVNLGMLGVFKYYDFFVGAFVEGFSLLGQSFSPRFLGWALPVGISFYTFQTLSYTIDVYRRELAPTRDAVAFFTYVAFFPQLVAGPIERARHLLPQFHRARRFDYAAAVLGLRQILWGLFKKMVIADNCAVLVDQIWNQHESVSGFALLVGAVLFAFQIYGDFSGYSDIAIGTARLFGFDLRRNFAYPYFSRDLGEFWRRWHISLSSWFRDYVYIPLGGSRGTTGRRLLNVWIVFLVSGLWHGANWTFLAWGAVHAAGYSLTLLGGRVRSETARLADLGRILLTFLVVCLGWVFFRSETVTQAGEIFGRIFSRHFLDSWRPQALREYAFLALAIPFLLAVEWRGRRDDFALARQPDGWPRALRYLAYAALAASLGLFLRAGHTPFIYFQF